MSDEIRDLKSGAVIDNDVDSIFMERIGKVESLEVYSGLKDFMMMFPNDYSIIVKKKAKSDRISVRIYYGVGDVTLDFFKTERASKKVAKRTVENLILKLEALEDESKK